MQYFYRSHSTPESVLGFATEYFTGRGLHGSSSGDTASYADARGSVSVIVEIEGGHYTRVTVGTKDVGESEIDRVAKRFLSELHGKEDHSHAVRGAY